MPFSEILVAWELGLQRWNGGIEDSLLDRIIFTPAKEWFLGSMILLAEFRSISIHGPVSWDVPLASIYR